MSKAKAAVTRAEKTGPRILISRIGDVGDCILTLPIVCALRREFPEAYLGWVVEKKSAPMVCGHDALDRVIELPRDWIRSVASFREVRTTLRSLEFDIVFDCQGSLKSALAGWLSGAPQRIGYGGKYGSRVSRMLNNVRVAPAFRHLTDRSLELLSPLGIHSPKVDWRLPISDASILWASRWRRKNQGYRLAVLNPGGTWPAKLWEADRFAATAIHLRQRYGYRCAVVWGNSAERAIADKIVALASGAAVLAPETDLNHLAALIGSAELFISGDSGPLHMAVAVGTPTIGLYGATRPGDSGPYGQIALQRAYEKGSLRHRRRADNSAMRAISVDDLCAAIDELESKRPLYERVA